MKKQTIMITGAAVLLIGGTTWTVANAEEKKQQSTEAPVVLASETTTSSSLSLDEAVKMAEDYVGGTMVKAVKDNDDGVALYEIDVRTDKETYEFDIAVDSGDIIEIDGDLLLTESTANPSLTKEEADQIAKAETGLSDIKKTELERKDGQLVYESEFLLEDDDGDIQMNAETGAVLKVDDDLLAATNTTATVQGDLLSFDDMIASLQDQFNEDVHVLESELDHDDGLAIYELDAVIGGIEYELDVNAANGEIIKQERD
ncbi:PepSY domain-containing protein [Bacillus sp. JCM 19041]|uniref:PepSY domain-containing protein n=1 Tax=Bacillus sp. JCM 19041 TaxID=1460637 RepID=UPI0006D168C5